MDNNKVTQITKKIVTNIPKILWAVLCYTVAIALAIASGYFTVVFYTDGSSGNDAYIMGIMAVSLELIKLMFSIGYPFMRYRNKQIENTVLWTMRICFFLSVMASMYYLLLGSNIERSPASKTVVMLYDYISILNIIPLKFSQFIATISLTVLIEFSIVYLPVVAPIMFMKKNYNRKSYGVSNLEKIKEIIVIIPERMIDRLHKKIIGDNEEVKSAKLPLLDNITDEKPEKPLVTNDIENSDEERLLLDNVGDENAELPGDLEVNKEMKSLLDNGTGDLKKNIDESNEKRFLKAIYNLKEDDTCPSVKQLVETTGISRTEIYPLKKMLEEAEILKTSGTKTKILCDYDSASSKIGI